MTDFRALCAELRHFVAEYQQMRGLDPENIYSIHQGIPEKEAHLRVSRLTLAADLLERLAPVAVPVAPTESDVTELFYRHMGEGSEVGFENAIAEAIARWGQS